MNRPLAAAALAALLLAACGPSGIDKAEADKGAPSEVAKPKSAEDARADVSAEVAAGGPGPAAELKTPAYAPIYPGAVVTSSTIGDSGIGAGGLVNFKVSDPPKTVIAYYEERMAAVGKPITMNSDVGGVHMLTAGDSGDGKGAMQVMVSAAGKGSEVQLTWSDE